MCEPGAWRKTHSRYFRQRRGFFIAQARIRVSGPAWFERIDDSVEPVTKNPQRVRPRGEAVRNGHGRPDHVRDEAIPYAGGVLGTADGAESATTAAEGVAINSVRTIHFLRDDANVAGDSGIGAVCADGRIDAGKRVCRARASAVRFDEDGPAFCGERNLVLLPRLLLGKMFAIRNGGDVLKEPASVLFHRRQMDRKQCFRPMKAAVHVSATHRLVLPFVDIDVGVRESQIDSEGREDGGVRH